MRLDQGVTLHRDPATGELQYSRTARRGGEVLPASSNANAPAKDPSSPATIRVNVQLVEVAASVTDAEGAHVPGLTPKDFRIFENGDDRPVSYFDASTEPASIALILDLSPSVLREWNDLRRAAKAMADTLAPRDEVALVTFAGYTRRVLPFTSDRALLDRAFASSQVEQGDDSSRGSEIYRSVYLAAQELFTGRRGRKAIVLLTDGQDTGLGLGWNPASAVPISFSDNRLTFEDTCRALAAAGIEIYVVSNQNRPAAMTEAWLAAHQNVPLVTDDSRESGMPHYTLYLAELVRRAGGRLFFLREAGTLADAWQRIAENLRVQYTLGFYPAASGASTAGWHSLRVEVPSRANVRITHRTAYYVPASP
ncbi:MAG: VWA domain-containing protein [Acidobacteria bacterium]|nr:VWA domain-containing protein [Acidobacteriota bacterium]